MKGVHNNLNKQGSDVGYKQGSAVWGEGIINKGVLWREWIINKGVLCEERVL